MSGPTHCPRCGKRAAYDMPICPASNFEIGAGQSAPTLEKLTRDMFAALDIAYRAMR